ncbi:hypothetical protein ND860_18675 [Leptospira levettii]|uniref:Uncharacterized protein n=1 Tax=Leptospira levettii TaxID=2023178 RepID=A0AAW5V9T0_9LEPT|nr:hypothetical protein [Leptospira levettii]MCW7467887.1 hypothetical protein [Leptospira levettii]MCW7498567.1 hypothetical protein [Leptospira levettii]MCW7513501.1 hypothetical protein [Leptospira levettii]MCW7517260.1 hypothetical protein [Leptospira levettii]
MLNLISCVKNQSINDGSLISLNDAEKEYSAVIFTKTTEYFPNYAFYFLFPLEKVDFRCHRDIHYDKSDFRKCMKNILLSNFQSRTPDELLSRIEIFKDTLCDLKKIILLKDSITKGELNLCEINP